MQQAIVMNLQQGQKKMSELENTCTSKSATRVLPVSAQGEDFFFFFLHVFLVTVMERDQSKLSQMYIPRDVASLVICCQQN